MPACAQLKFKFGCFLLFDSHENWSSIRPNTPNIMTLLYEKYQRDEAASADAITTVSPLLVTYLKALFPTKEVLLLPNAVPNTQAPEDSRAVDFYRSQLEQIAAGRVTFLLDRKSVCLGKSGSVS